MKKIVIVGFMDGNANAVRPQKIQQFLKAYGYDAKIIDMCPAKVDREQLKAQVKKRASIPRVIRNTAFLLLKIKESIHLNRQLKKEKPYAVIFENEIYALHTIRRQPYQVILDCPAPWVAEWNFSGDLSKAVYLLAAKIEKRIYKKATALCFHWENYTRFVQKNVYDGSNIFKMNWACEKRTVSAKYTSPTKIVFLGNLGGYWNNLDLLAKLSQTHDIDVYGAPAPPADLGLNYKGYAPTTDVLADYQFGLITLSKDQLRTQSFSSKQLEYMSYGLPVLTPEWRQDPTLKDYSIYYNEANFDQKVAEFSDRKKWQAMADANLATAKKWSWENNLQPLLGMLEGKDKS